MKANETNKIKTVSVEKNGVTYGYQIGQPQPGYVLMNIPYAEFYAGEGITEVDGVSSATKNKPRTATLAGGSYHKNADGTDISGVIYPVYVEDLAMLSDFKQVTDADSVEITVTNRGQTTTTSFTGRDALFENEDHAYYVLDAAPNAYKTLTIEDGKCSFSATTAVVENGEATVTPNYSDHHADVVLTLTSDALNANKATVSGAIVTAKDAGGAEKAYALRHVAEIWRVSQIGWSWDSMDGTGLAGQTVTGVTYFLTDAEGNYKAVHFDLNETIKLHGVYPKAHIPGYMTGEEAHYNFFMGANNTLYWPDDNFYLTHDMKGFRAYFYIVHDDPSPDPAPRYRNMPVQWTIQSTFGVPTELITPDVQPSTTPKKILRDGEILLVIDGQLYDLTGRRK